MKKPYASPQLMYMDLRLLPIPPASRDALLGAIVKVRLRSGVRMSPERMLDAIELRPGIRRVLCPNCRRVQLLVTTGFSGPGIEEVIGSLYCGACIAERLKAEREQREPRP